MDAFKKALVAAGFNGDLEDSAERREFYSHDASLFEVVPQLIVCPKTVADVQILVKVAADHKKNIPDLSLTARSAGTDMSGGAVNDSVIVDFNKYLQGVTEVSATEGHALPGTFFRDFEAETAKLNVLLPCYPASRELCTIGGMVANNSGGEKSLEYGKTQRFINELKVVFADSN